MTRPPPEADSAADHDFGLRLAALVERAIGLDSRFRIPLINVRVGWDAIVSAIPVIGDIAMAVVAASLVRDAHRLGVRRATLARMTVNVLLDLVIGMVPFVGPILDIFFRANLRNAQLATDDLARRRLKPSPPR